MFDACQVLSYGNLENERQISGENTGVQQPCGARILGIDRLPYSSWSEVWWITKYQGGLPRPKKLITNWPPYKLNCIHLNVVHQTIASIHNPQ
jgi:hypothetical protein